MEEELSLLKKSLISLVVSSPTTMTVSRLIKDYRSLVGGVLPLAKYGYREPVTFLRERCTDIFVVEGPSWDPILTPKVTKNLLHIDKMVQKQKVHSTVKFKGKRRSVFQLTPPVASKPFTGTDPPNRYYTPNRYDPPNRNDTPNRYDPPNRNDTQNRYDTSNSQPVVREKDITKQIQVAEPKITQEKEDYNLSKRCTDKNNYNNDYDSSHHSDKASLSNNNNINYQDIDSNSVEESRPNSALSKFYKKRLPQYTSDMDFPGADTELTSKGSAESGRQSSASSTSKQALLDELKTEIIQLIKESVDGVWCTDLIRLYKQKYGQELKFNRFGYTNIISLVYSMADRVDISRPTTDGDWLLKEPAAAACARASARVRPAPRATRDAADADSDSDADADADAEALPGVDFEADVFPSDCLHYMESIPRLRLDDLASGSQLEVIIGEVYSPSHFWMLRVGPDYNLAMEQIMDEMTAYYRGEGAGRVLARGALREGQYCASLFDRDWHRSLIVSIVDSDTVKVQHVDYGTVALAAAGALKPLRREWGALPAQAVRARLAACRPPGAGWRWPRASCAWFLHRVRDARLYANVLTVDREEDAVETFLTDTTGAEDVCLARDLIREGHADRRADSALKSSDRYLYPRFSALERGATPNYADICRILADGITLDYVESYRIYVPGPWAPASRPPPPPPSPPAPPSPPEPAPAPLSPQPLELLNRVPLLRIDDCATAPRPPRPVHHCRMRHSIRAPAPSPTYSARPVLPSPAPTRPLRPLAIPSPRPPATYPLRPLRPPAIPSPRNLATYPLRPLAIPSPSPPATNPLQPLAIPSPRPPATYPLRPLRPPAIPSPRPLATYPLRPLAIPSPSPPATNPLRPLAIPSPRPPATYPLPPPGLGAGEVRLNAEEWALLAHLRGLDPVAARWYLLTQLWRAALPPGF